VWIKGSHIPPAHTLHPGKTHFQPVSTHIHPASTHLYPTSTHLKRSLSQAGRGSQASGICLVLYGISLGSIYWIYQVDMWIKHKEDVRWRDIIMQKCALVGWLAFYGLNITLRSPLKRLCSRQHTL